MAKISHHGSCRQKYTIELKCIRAEKSNRWNGKCGPWQCQTNEIRQRLYWSPNKTAIQKYLEDNQATGLFTCKSFTTQNSELFKICHLMWRTGYDGRRWNQKKLQPQGIIAVKRISIRYSLYVLTIEGQNIPKKINIGYLKKETRPYIPNPQRCFQCQKFGHTKNSCKGKAVCAGCGEEGHNLDDCQNEPKCVNCQCDQVAISRDCPKWKIEKDIVTLKYTEKISFADARKRLQPSFDPSEDSYATVTRTPPRSSRPLPPWAKKIRLPIDFKTEIEYLKYILNYCLTRLYTLDEITSENPIPRNAPSLDETPPPPQTTPEQKNETTIPSTESALQSAASNDDEN